MGEADSKRMGSWQGEGRVLIALPFNLGERKFCGRVLDRKTWYYVRTSRVYSDSTRGSVEARRATKDLQK